MNLNYFIIFWTSAILIDFSIPDKLFAQWKVVTKQYITTKTHYSIHSDNLKLISGFYFPEDGYDSALFKGYSPIKKQKIKGLDFIGKGKIFAWKKTFGTPIQCEYDSTFLYHRLFIRGIESYSIYLLSGVDDNWYKMDFKVNFDRYQLPFMCQLSQWQLVENDIKNITKKNSDYSLISDSIRQNTIKEIMITIKPKSERFEFVIGELKIFNKRLIDVEFHHPFFDKITKINSFRYLEKDSFYKFPGRPTLLSSNGNYDRQTIIIPKCPGFQS